MVESLEMADFKPPFAAEPGFLSFGVLTCSGDDEFLALVAGDFAVEESSDFRNADGFGGVGGYVSHGSDFLDGTAVEHGAGAKGDAAVEVGACALNENASKRCGLDCGGGFPLVAQFGGFATGEQADFECAGYVAFVVECGARGFDGVK